MIITLCGSARFENAFKKWDEVLTLAGHVVFSLAVYPSDKRHVKTWYTDAEKETLDCVHKLKIDASHAIFVVDQSRLNASRDDEPPYIGESTASEIQHARSSGKRIFYASETRVPDDVPGLTWTDRNFPGSVMATQTAEFDALKDLISAYTDLTMVSIVDDDYPRFRHLYEAAVRRYAAALSLNRGNL